MYVMTRIALWKVSLVLKKPKMSDMKVGGVNKGVEAIFLSKVESGKQKSNFEIEVEVEQ